jgi:hypothetical protein
MYLYMDLVVVVGPVDDVDNQHFQHPWGFLVLEHVQVATLARETIQSLLWIGPDGILAA